MKKKSLSILFVTLLSLLVGCQVGNSSSTNLSSSSSDRLSDKSTTTSNSSSTTSSSQTISSSSSQSTSISSSSTSSLPIYVDLETKTFNYSNYNDIGKYSTGNYETVYAGGVNFTHYRAKQADKYGDMITLLPYNSSNDSSLAGMIYNTSAIKGIKEFVITYHTQNGSGSSPILRYGNDISVSNYIELEASTSEISKTINVSNANYFKIETNGYKLHINEIEVHYTGEGTLDTYTYLGSGEDHFRINPVVFEGTKVSGQSSVNVPVSVSQNGDSYLVEEYKTYTYYDYNSVSSNPSLADKAAYTSPEDVAAYFVAFGCAPANYVAKKSYSSAFYIFGRDTRCVSNYKRTDGYARFVPWNRAPGQTYPFYYECDIDLDGSYSNNNRGVGRVVVWLYGFDAQGYDDSPVAVYTDDHYATFLEYLNTGIYGTRFNAELSPTNYKWSSPAILTA